MDDYAKQALHTLNKQFYDSRADSFSATRGKAWPGWERVVQQFPKTEGLRVLDVACGNMRFEKFAADRLVERGVSFLCVDSCPALSVAGDCWDFREMDVLDELAGHGDLSALIDGGLFDACVSFGFMHHVPGYDERVRLLRALVHAVRSGGTVAVSLWRFASDARLAEKARETTARALETRDVKLEENDYLLGWDGDASVVRYCHHFDEAEVTRLVSSVSDIACVADRFVSDGRTGSLNEYVVLTRL